MVDISRLLCIGTIIKVVVRCGLNSNPAVDARTHGSFCGSCRPSRQSDGGKTRNKNRDIYDSLYVENCTRHFRACIEAQLRYIRPFGQIDIIRFTLSRVAIDYDA